MPDFSKSTRLSRASADSLVGLVETYKSKSMKNLFLTLLVSTVALSLPAKTFAAVCYSPATPGNFSELICVFIDLISTAIPIVGGLALLVFFWGLAKFILNAGNESGREEGKEVMKWGIVALFVMVSIWGIIFFITNDVLGLATPGVPQLPTSPTR